MPRSDTDGFRSYLQERGYDPEDSRAMLWRMFVVAWEQPGFHRFWRVWNPMFGYGLHRLYRGLGGDAHPQRNTLLVFGFSGFVLHDVPVALLTGSWSTVATGAFLLYGLLALRSKSRATGREPRTSPWSRRRRAAANVAQVLLGLVLSVLAHRLCDAAVTAGG